MATLLQCLEKEYTFWMSKRITPVGLNQHGTNAKDERAKLINYYGLAMHRIGMDENAPEEEQIRIALNLLAELESGEDFTPRYENHNATEYVQIDLNSHLYGVERFLSDYYRGKDEKKSAYYQAQKERRLALIEKYCYNEKTGVYGDYNFVQNKQNNVVCAANFLPYFYGFARKGSRISAIYEKLKTKGGVQEYNRNVPEEAQDYPEVYVYGRILLAKGIYFRHIEGLTLENVTVETYREDTREDFVFDDVNEV